MTSGFLNASKFTVVAEQQLLRELRELSQEQDRQEKPLWPGMELRQLST